MHRLIPLIALLLCVACGRSETSPPTTASTPATTPVAAPAPAAPPPPAAAPAAPAAPAADPAAPAAAPPGASVADAARGVTLYHSLCASCHGAKGAGDGPAGQSLNPRPAHHNDGNYMNALSNEHLFKVIKEGGPSVGKSPMMAPWGGALSDAQIRDVIAYIRTLADPPYKGPQP